MITGNLSSVEDWIGISVGFGSCKREIVFFTLI